MVVRVMEPNGNKSVATVLPRLGGPGVSVSFNLTPLLSLLVQGGWHEGRVVQVSNDCVAAVAGNHSQAVALRLHGVLTRRRSCCGFRFTLSQFPYQVPHLPYSRFRPPEGNPT